MDPALSVDYELAIQIVNSGKPHQENIRTIESIAKEDTAGIRYVYIYAFYISRMDRSSFNYRELTDLYQVAEYGIEFLECDSLGDERSRATSGLIISIYREFMTATEDFFHRTLANAKPPIAQSIIAIRGYNRQNRNKKMA
jgi:hypothetical protein